MSDSKRETISITTFKKWPWMSFFTDYSNPIKYSHDAKNVHNFSQLDHLTKQRGLSHPWFQFESHLQIRKLSSLMYVSIQDQKLTHNSYKNMIQAWLRSHCNTIYLPSICILLAEKWKCSDS